MLGRFLLHIRQLSARESLPRRLMGACLLVFSELEARVLRPHEHTWLRYAYLRNAGIRFSRPCYFSQGFRLFRAANCTIGPRACFGENCGLYVHAEVKIGADFLAAPGFTLNNGAHNLATLQPSAAPISIGDRVWCGINVTVVAGARIGDDCIIGANSLVMHDIPPRSLAFGVPARVIRREIRPVDHPKIWSTYASS